jgi:hypothetical protein
MGLQPGTTAAPRLSETQRCYILGHTTDVDILSWLIRESTLHPKEGISTTNTHLTPQATIAKDLQILRPTQKQTPDLDRSPPQPILWHPLHNPTEWIYTDGSLKTGEPRIGASVIHSPTATTTYIDASGQDESHTIIRAEIVAIHVALDNYKNDNWIGIFTDS